MDIFFCLLVGESITGGIQNPRVVVGALHASVESEDFSGQFSGGKRAGVGQGTERLALDVALLLPLLEVPETSEFSGVLHPLDNL